MKLKVKGKEKDGLVTGAEVDVEDVSLETIKGPDWALSHDQDCLDYIMRAGIAGTPIVDGRVKVCKTKASGKNPAKVYLVHETELEDI